MTVKSRAAVLYKMEHPTPYTGSRPLVIEEVELTGPGVGQVLVEIAGAGLCHSDLSVIDGSRPRGMPMVMGHEASGGGERCRIRTSCPRSSKNRARQC